MVIILQTRLTVLEDLWHNVSFAFYEKESVHWNGQTKSNKFTKLLQLATFAETNWSRTRITLEIGKYFNLTETDKLKLKLKLLTINRRQRNNKSFNLLVLKKTGKINFWNMFFFKNGAIESRANVNTYSNRPMTINALVARNFPNWEYGNVSYILHYFKKWCQHTCVIYD